MNDTTHQANGTDQLRPKVEDLFTETVRGIGGTAVLDLFNTSELSGTGSVASPDGDEMTAIAVNVDGNVHVRHGPGESFHLPYARARELAVHVAREQLAAKNPQTDASR